MYITKNEVKNVITIVTKDGKQHSFADATQVVVMSKTGSNAYPLDKFLDVKEPRRYILFHDTTLLFGVNTNDIESIKAE
ncbi:hypothetical protein FC16_GL000070 [Loigolactobacillus coryniformis subsp. torquens DSM 20004 = KCTC 3535]|uniref:Uncharacterized protein n=1 Tax=Loigolactobacillus coryniformis subsp. coryniformis KCTC 3167 = DSM 20001 TaxID=913848 RepID=A0A0R1F3K1_9LACO|nr:hypothetical protein FD22_GL001250 [Loigolactobacillus coryniformis subsp. coryniformis KCTC 3167 = DSM 20001]KRK85676.1 hypothetical protein FC16_GL000070 [Loigolactobacillus coryniformis subsp. torquens DSM 20004 = KCTC 3535]